MKAREAHEIVKELAAGRYCTTEYRITDYIDNKVKSKVECGVYIAGHNHCIAPNFALALAKMEEQLGTAQVEEDQEE